MPSHASRKKPYFFTLEDGINATPSDSYEEGAEDEITYSTSDLYEEGAEDEITYGTSDSYEDDFDEDEECEVEAYFSTLTPPAEEDLSTESIRGAYTGLKIAYGSLVTRMEKLKGEYEALLLTNHTNRAKVTHGIKRLSGVVCGARGIVRRLKELPSVSVPLASEAPTCNCYKKEVGGRGRHTKSCPASGKKTCSGIKRHRDSLPEVIEDLEILLRTPKTESPARCTRYPVRGNDLSAPVVWRGIEVLGSAGKVATYYGVKTSTVNWILKKSVRMTLPIEEIPAPPKDIVSRK